MYDINSIPLVALFVSKKLQICLFAVLFYLVEGIVNMPPNYAAVLRLIPVLLGFAGGLIYYENGEWITCALFSLSGFLGLITILIDRQYWDFIDRLKISALPMFSFLLTAGFLYLTE
jgi:hypothetical protein